MLDRSVGILEAVATGARTFTDIASATGLTRPTAHRLIKALERQGFLRLQEGLGYRLGPKLFRLGTLAAGELPIRDVARPALDRLTHATGESSQLYVRVDDERVCIDAVESTNELRTIVPVGASLPLTAGSAGKVFLAWAGEGDVERLLDGMTGAVARRRELATIRRRGWAQSAGERQVGVGSVSAPVRDRAGGIVAAVSVSGPVTRLRGLHARRHAPAVVEAAREIEAALGVAMRS